jgi:hypothetical protein
MDIEETPEQENNDLHDLLAESEVPTYIEVEKPETKSEVVSGPKVEIKQDKPIPDDEVQKIFKKFLDISNTILLNYNADREQIEKTIQYLDTMTQMGPKSGRVYIEMLVAALRTKAETNTNAVKLLDAMAKFLSAGKGTQIFVQQNQASAPSDLVKLLETPEYPDEKRVM